MLTHFGADNCPSGIIEEGIDNIACDFFQSWNYKISEDGGWLYQYPSYDKKFLYLSTLYQRTEDVLMYSALVSRHGFRAKLEQCMTRSL